MAHPRLAFAIGLLAVGALSLAAASGLLPLPSGTLDVEIPTRLEPSSQPGASLLAGKGALALSIAPAALAFGPLAPGETSPAVTLTVTNPGAVPVRVRLAASPLAHADGLAEIPAEAFTFAKDASDAAPALAGDGLVLAPGAPLRLDVRLALPSASSQYVPAGDYAGALKLTAEVTG